MTAGKKHIDPALDRALASSPEPMAPAGLAGRIAQEATAKGQRKTSGLLRSRRTRPVRGRGRRRPMIMGAIAGGFLAASAVAAALVSEGYVDVSHLTRPVVALFSPDHDSPPVEISSPPTESARQDSGAVGGEVTEIETIRSDREPQSASNTQRLSPWQRAFVIRRAMLRRQARRAAAGLPAATPRQRAAERRAIRRTLRRREAAMGNAEPLDGSRIREAVRNGRITPEQGERLEALRVQRNQRIETRRERLNQQTETGAALTPRQRQQRRAMRRERLRELRRNRMEASEEQQTPDSPAEASDTAPAASPFRPLPVDDTPDSGETPSNQSGANLPERLTLDRANWPPPEIMNSGPDTPAVRPDRRLGVWRAERFRRARQRRANQRRQRPRRPRNPHRRR